MLGIFAAQADNGHSLWLYPHKANKVTVICARRCPVLDIAQQELQQGWLGKHKASVLLLLKTDKQIKGDGYRLSAQGVQANTALGILYGVYELLRRQVTGKPVAAFVSNPSYQRRILNHWDNLNGTIERGYAGRSVFWRNGPDSMIVTAADRRLWLEYARANASIGINGIVLNNVNASPFILSEGYLERTKAIAAVLRTYGIKTYLSVNFSSPARLGGPKTADPLDPEVISWWQAKVKAIYSQIPDFGGFLVKANSEGQPGPQDHGRTHADGANMMARALKPFGGIVMWRAFVYSPTEKDRAKQAYAEFTPLDGQFMDNVIIQVKNGPIDFQPREPFSPLFGAMKHTAMMPELQITQEYLGQAQQLVFLASAWQECLQSDTYQAGTGSTVARCTDGSIYPQKYTAIAGVANIGLDSNWCGHPFAQANWYAFGRLAWSNDLSSSAIADEWLKQTFLPVNKQPGNSNFETGFIEQVKKMMLESREAAVNYMMPLGLHHLFAADHHYGPGPWYAPLKVRADWTPPYYHKADTNGIGFDRTATGSNAVSQYHEPLRSKFGSVASCPEIYLLWFHHLPWDHHTKSGLTLWDDLCLHYETGVKQVQQFQAVWEKTKPYVDDQRFTVVQQKLKRQSRDAQVWKDACLLYFQQFSRRPFPAGVTPAVYDLTYLQHTDPRVIDK